MAIESINPTTGELTRRFEPIGAQAVDDALTRSWATYLQWRETSFAERAELLKKAATLLRENTREYATIITREMGKPIKEADAEIEKCAWVCEFYADNAEAFLTPRSEPSDGVQSYVRYDPIGPVLAVMPWNFPFWQVFRFAAPALMGGNVAVLKHASNVPLCALAIQDIFTQAGFPEGAFTTLLVGSSQVEAIIADKRIAAVTLTGSEHAGRAVAAAAGRALKKTVLELGGSDAFVVLEDADVERAAKMAVASRLLNTGQSCIAAKRFIVVRAVAERFTEAVVAGMDAVRMGNPMDETTQLGPMARDDLRRDLHDQLRRSLAGGAQLKLGGTMSANSGYFYPPTLLVGLNGSHVAMREETFGPLGAIAVVDDERAAIALANDSDYGLGGALWTGDIERGRRLAAKLESGAVFVNGFTKSDPRLPFGGVKLSGYGRELSSEGIREFMNVKTVWIGE